MAEYRLYKLDGRDRIREAACIVECGSDEEAAAAADALLTGDAVVEVWEGARLVCRRGGTEAPEQGAG